MTSTGIVGIADTSSRTLASFPKYNFKKMPEVGSRNRSRGYEYLDAAFVRRFFFLLFGVVEP